ncbi:hypothetical protein B0H14DRAFT_2607466 [Mycena olivaceomarginata]|nr:hypothetical protein B0H14DRAFT_2607466 [Mycena olivaceomarginata]
MSTVSSPARPTPRKRQTARMSTGGRRPPKVSSSQFVDDEAEHDSDGSNGEENVDKYESDFINDAMQEGEPIEWPDSPPRAEENTDDSDGDAASTNKDQPAVVKRGVNKKSAADSASLIRGRLYFGNLTSAAVRLCARELNVKWEQQMMALASALRCVSDSAEWNTYGPDTVHLTASVDLDARMGNVWAVVCANALMTTSNTDGDYIWNCL